MQESLGKSIVCVVGEVKLADHNGSVYLRICSLDSIVAMLVPEYDRDKVGEVILFIGPASVGEKEKLLSFTELFSIWGEEAVQSQLYLSHRNFDTYGHISRGLCEKGYDQDTVQCRAKIKELRQAYHKANHCSGASPKTCQFYKELDAIFGSDPTSTTKSTVDILAGLEAVERGPNLEKVVIDKEVELDNHVELLVRSPGGAGSQELFTTPELSSNSQQLLSSEQEAGEEMPGKWLWFV
ncbi:Zinc finger and SCAN domain-containing protein 20 [Chelonia mydas]|uniref:Zinc finger and SCAN domain-containing protein 20 n=1 Tax=Chelonia mydas TaxID=8469 RepID=M7BXU6_CHEMY|nr:Zinc finger and SCAN domain-containing protein 20 [Chelonia mydas]